MNIEEEKGEKKAKGIAFQAQSHTEETKSVCDEDGDLAESLAKITKRLNRSCPINRNSGSVSTGVITPRRNTPTNAGNFNRGSRN